MQHSRFNRLVKNLIPLKDSWKCHFIWHKCHSSGGKGEKNNANGVLFTIQSTFEWIFSFLYIFMFWKHLKAFLVVFTSMKSRCIIHDDLHVRLDWVCWIEKSQNKIIKSPLNNLENLDSEKSKNLGKILENHFLNVFLKISKLLT